jgi:hypothetical protein
LKILFLVNILLSFPVYSQAINIEESSVSNLVLNSTSCKKLVQQHQAICQWKNNTNKNFKIPKITESLCNKKLNNSYEMKISHCLPRIANNYHQQELFQDGANCWGTAMNFKALSLKPRFMWSQEMRYWIDSPICRKLNVDEKKLPGDLINTYGPERLFGDEKQNKGKLFWQSLYPDREIKPRYSEGYTGYHHFLHSETFISDELSFGKNSPSYEARFKFRHLNRVYGRSQDKRCQENQSLVPNFREKQNKPKMLVGSICGYLSLAYRCENFKGYFSKKIITKKDKDLWNSIQKLKIFQAELFELMINKKASISSARMDEMLSLSDQAVSESLSKLKQKKYNKITEMLYTLKYFTAAAIRKSLELAAMIPSSENI